MTTEIEVYRRELAWILDQMCRSVDGLTLEQISSRPAKSANSPFAIGNHVIAATRVYALGFGCGLPVRRNRVAEFNSAPTSSEELIKRLRRLAAQVERVLAGLTATVLEELIVPPADLWGSSPRREICRREALVESVRHAALHLGELRLTRDLVVQGMTARDRGP